MKTLNYTFYFCFATGFVSSIVSFFVDDTTLLTNGIIVMGFSLTWLNMDNIK